MSSCPVVAVEKQAKPDMTQRNQSGCGGCWSWHMTGGSVSVSVEDSNRLRRMSSSSSSHTLEVQEFRRRLKYFFMNPCEKYRARGRKPWKLTLQVLKIVVITAQLVSFGLSNEMMVTFKEENLMTFRNLFLKGCEDHQQRSLALYTKADVYDHISHVVSRYVHLRNLTVGNLAYAMLDGARAPLLVCQVLYGNSSIDPENETFYIDPRVDTDCISISPLHLGHNKSLLSELSLDFRRLLSVNIYLTLKTINLQTVRHHELPDCYDFHIMITFDNRAHSGKVKVRLESDVRLYECTNWVVEGSPGANDYMLVLFDSGVIIACFISLVLCTRSVISGVRLQFEFHTFFLTHYNKSVTWSDRMEFVNGWYILIIVSDSLATVGSVLKIGIQTKFLTNYDICSILLGTATMLAWVGVIRYLGFFKKYNILILTLRAAFPNVIRFCCCATMIYLGYCFCGWIILGPYHDKFRTLDKVAECLFSLINGDDMYGTFQKMRDKSYTVWLFSRLYLYSYISLFIYMVLSLFIALITDTYETIKLHQPDKSPVSQLQVFMGESRDQPDSEGQPASCCHSSCCFG